MTLLERVKLLCRENKVSQRTVEKECDLSNGAISKWKNSSPSADALSKVAEYFHVSTDYLLGWTDDPIDYDDPELNAELYGPTYKAQGDDAKKALAFKQAEAEDAMRENALRSLRAAFFDGYADDLDPAEIDELWEDARTYAQFKAQQRLNKKKK